MSSVSLPPSPCSSLPPAAHTLPCTAPLVPPHGPSRAFPRANPAPQWAKEAKAGGRATTRRWRRRRLPSPPPLSSRSSLCSSPRPLKVRPPRGYPGPRTGGWAGRADGRRGEESEARTFLPVYPTDNSHPPPPLLFFRCSPLPSFPRRRAPTAPRRCLHAAPPRQRGAGAAAAGPKGRRARRLRRGGRCLEEMVLFFLSLALFAFNAFFSSTATPSGTLPLRAPFPPARLRSVPCRRLCARP